PASAGTARRTRIMGTNFAGLRHLRMVLLGCAAVLACPSAHAQDAPPVSAAPTVTLETIDVNPTSTRLGTAVPSRPARQRDPQPPRRVAPAQGPSAPAVPGA